MFENCRPSDSIEVINSRSEPDCASDVRCAGFEPVWRLLECALFQSNAHDHLTATVPRWHGVQNFLSNVQRADASRPTHLMSGKRQKVAAQRPHIEWQMSDALCGIHERQRAYSVRFFT